MEYKIYIELFTYSNKALACPKSRPVKSCLCVVKFISKTNTNVDVVFFCLLSLIMY